jgi:transcriptional regulator with XRE-family HTH domain
MNKAEKILFQKRIGEHLKLVRERKGVSAAELARKTGTERATIARIETGRTNPTATTMQMICQALETSFSELFEGFYYESTN